MSGVTTPELVAAASNAGGLGILRAVQKPVIMLLSLGRGPIQIWPPLRFHFILNISITAVGRLY